MEYTAERRYAEQAGVVLAGMGLPLATGKMLGWLLICTPAAQSGAEIAAALGLSKGSVSAGLRTLEASGLARRVPMPGRRGIFFEITPDALLRAAMSDKYAQIGQLMADGVKIAGGEDSPEERRLRVNRVF